MTESGEEPFHQNQEAAKRFKPAQKRKQPGSTAFSAASTVVAPPRPLSLSTSSSSSTPASSSPYSSSSSLLPSNTINNNNINTALSTSTSSPGFVYQQPTSLQHQRLPSQTLLALDPNGFGEWSIQTAPSNLEQGPDLAAAASKVVTAEEMDGLAAMLSETTLSNISYYGPSAAATIADDYDDEDLWGPQIRSVNSTEDSVVPSELQILPDISTRQQLTELYYKNHYLLLPMVQREVLHVCEKNIHIPHCLLLCNAVYYCGSMFSTNTLPLRKDLSDEGTVGEIFFQRGQALLEKKYLTTHLCTVQSLLLFAIGHKSPAQRSAFISQAITMALDMGLHSKMDESVNKFMRAYRARVFWCCFIFDSTSSAIGGKPTLINDEEIHVDMVEPGDLGPESENYSDQYILHCVRGWQICRRIRKNSKLVLMRPPPSKSVLLENLDRLDKDLVEWQEQMPKVFDLVPTKGSITSDVKALAAGAQLLCYALIILLHHPYLPNPKSAEAFQSPRQGGPPDSQGYCTQAAKEITKISGILLKDAPRTFEQNTPARYALNFAIRIHLRNSKCTIDSTLAKESRRDLQKSMDYVEQVENLQFFRINRSKKSDVADLLASCRAALAQQKSSLDLAKEAAAVKHRQLLQAKLLARDQMRQQQQQQQQQQQEQQQQQQQQQQLLQQQHQRVFTQQQQAQAQYERQNLHHQLQLNLPQQSSTSRFPQTHRNFMDQHQEHLQNTQQHLHVNQSQLQQQHQAHIQQMNSNIIQHQQQQQQHLQLLRHQHHQEQLRHRQQEQLNHQQSRFALAVPIQQQQQLQQQYLQDSHEATQQLQSSHHYPQVNSGPTTPTYQSAVLFQGQPSFAPPTTSADQQSLQLAQPQQQQQARQDQHTYTSWITDPQQDASALYHSSNDQLSGNGLFGAGEDMIDIQSIVFDPRHEALFSTAASNAFSSAEPVDVNRNLKDPTLHVAPNLAEDVFLTSVPRSQTSSLVNSHLTPPLLDNGSLSPMSPDSGAPSTVVSPQMHTTSVSQTQQSLSRHMSPVSKSNLDNRVTQSSIYQHGSTPEHSGLMSSWSVVSSPGGSGLMSEEAVLESFRGQMIHDTFFMHVNLPAEHPRNDPTSFVYLPSELEYGDTTALSPAGGESTNSSEVDALSPRPL